MANGHGGKRQGAGRKKGSENKVTTELKEAILLAADEHGRDGAGEDGLKGYLRKVASEDTKAFTGLLGRVLPLTVNGGMKLGLEDPLTSLLSQVAENGKRITDR